MAQKRIDFISFEDFSKLYKFEKDKKMKLCLLLGFGSGLRISEIIGLNKEISPCCRKDIIRERKKSDGKTLKILVCSECKKEIKLENVKRHLTEWKIPPLTKDKIDIEKHQIKIDMAKGNKWRITITAPLLTENMLELLPIKMGRRTLQLKFEQLSINILNKKMSFHTLRHGFGNYQANILKIPLPIVQQMMGHTRLDTTGIYTKANPEESIKKVWEAMNG